MNDLKHTTKLNKRNTTAKVITCEYAICNEDGSTTVTTNQSLVNQALEHNKQVFMVKTYQITTKTKLSKDK